jgi:xanthine dehydrogenase molybdopterin-binding subunit B
MYGVCFVLQVLYGVCRALKLRHNEVHVTSKRVGGGFGGKVRQGRVACVSLQHVSRRLCNNATAAATGRGVLLFVRV